MDQDDHSPECIVSCVKNDWPFVCPKRVQQSRNFWVVSWRWSDDPSWIWCFSAGPRLGTFAPPMFCSTRISRKPQPDFIRGVAQHVFHHPTNCSRCESPLRGLEGDRSERLPERLEDFFAQIKGGLGDHHLVGCHQGLSCEVIRKLLPDSYIHVIYIYM